MPADEYINYLPAGQPKRKVRDFLRYRIHWKSFDRDEVVEEFGGDITDELLRNGLIEPARKKIYSRDNDDSTDGEIIPGYRVSHIGRRFAAKLLIPPLARSKAERIVNDMLTRADAINRNCELLCWIERITLFGSYLTASPIVGDIDVGLDIRSKKGLRIGWARVEWHKLALARVHAAGRYFMSYSDALEYPKIEVYRILKARIPYLSIASEIIVDDLDTPKRYIWPAAPSPHVQGPDGKRYTSIAVIEHGRHGRRG